MRLTNQQVIEKAKQIGFDLIGFAKADLLENESNNLKEWLDNDYQAGMDYMQKNFEKRKDVRQILPEAKSVISLGLNYYTPDLYSNEENEY